MLYKFKVTRFLTHHLKNPSKFQTFRTFVDNVEIKFIRDRGLDHAVEREKDLKPMINLKNLLKLEPSKSLPLSSIVDSKDTLKIPVRPIDFIRKYPSVFEEYFPGNIGIHPHVRLTPESLNLDAEEQLVYDSVNVRESAAERLLKLLMLCRVNEIPLKLIDKLKWDLGLPDNYADTLVPEFPDYFQVKRGNGVEGLLELVCWSDELAVSVMEKMAKKANSEYQKGMPLAFPLKYSTGFEMDKRLKKWIDEWQKLPYISPYENAAHLQPNSDESDKWAVAVLHELLHILVPKKTDRENILCLGEYLGIRARFKRAVAHHPGIFYLSSKMGTYTVVLREGYKRGLLIDKHPLMEMRSKYIHLLHAEKKEAEKPKNVQSNSDNKQQGEGGGVVEKENEDNGKGQNKEMCEFDSDAEEISDDDEEDDDDEEEEEEQRGRGRRSSGRRESGMVNDKEQVRDNGRRKFSRDNVEETRGGMRGERGSNKVYKGKQAVDGDKSERRRFSKAKDEEGTRGGMRSGRGFSKAYKGKQAADGQRSGRRGTTKVYDEDRSKGGFRSGGRGSHNVNEEDRSKGGYRGGGRGSHRVNEEETRGGRNGGTSRVNFVERASGGFGNGRRDSGKVNEGGMKGKENFSGRGRRGSTPYQPNNLVSSSSFGEAPKPRTMNSYY